MSTNDTRTPEEIAYDSLRDGSAYVRKPEAPSALLQAVADFIAPYEDDELAIAAEVDRLIAAQRQPFGTLADGTPMYGTFDTTTAGAGTRDGCVSVQTPAINLTADHQGYFSGENGRDDWTINFDGASLEDIRLLRDFLNSGAIERMAAAAVAWENGADNPPEDTDQIISILKAVEAVEQEYKPLSPAWEKVLDIIDDPMNDGRA